MQLGSYQGGSTLRDEDIRTYFRGLVGSNSLPKIEEIPPALLNRLTSWRWGQYGWLSPASIILSACVWKLANPSGDCCKIWARDSENQQIPGGYSLRSIEESQIIPVLAEFDLCNDFCSSNGGMQGARAIEKARAAGRIDRVPRINQSTLWDQPLFGAILNDINDSSPTAVLECTKFIIQIARSQRVARKEAWEAIGASNATIDLHSFSWNASDPAFVTCFAGACLRVIGTPSGLRVTGAQDHVTASDARASKPGDLALYREKVPVAAFEVKDKTRELDWQNLRKAEDIVDRFPTIRVFGFILENQDALETETVRQIRRAAMARDSSVSFEFLSLRQLHNIARVGGEDTELWTELLAMLENSPSVKSTTRESLKELLEHSQG